MVLTAVRNDASAIQHATTLDKLDPDIISECCRDPAFTFHMANISLEELETVFPVLAAAVQAGQKHEEVFPEICKTIRSCGGIVPFLEDPRRKSIVSVGGKGLFRWGTGYMAAPAEGGEEEDWRDGTAGDEAGTAAGEAPAAERPSLTPRGEALAEEAGEDEDRFRNKFGKAMVREEASRSQAMMPSSQAMMHSSQMHEQADQPPVEADRPALVGRPRPTVSFSAEDRQQPTQPTSPTQLTGPTPAAPGGYTYIRPDIPEDLLPHGRKLRIKPTRIKSFVAAAQVPTTRLASCIWTFDATIMKKAVR